MRYFVIVAALLCASPAEARRHVKPKRAVHVVKDTRSAEQYARAEAELADLRSAKELPAAAPEPRVQYEQDNDRETPPGLRR